MALMNIAFIVVIIALLVTAYAMGTNTVTMAQATPTTPGKSSPPSTVVTTPGASTGNFYRSDASITGSPITNDPATWPTGDPIWSICNAVAHAEGYNQGAGTAPYDLNNPGDLSPGDEDNLGVCGNPQVHGGSSIIVFCTAEDGWTALYNKFDNIVTGQSSTYAVTDTWAQVASKYAGNSAAWLNNVTSFLGVDPSSTPADYYNANAETT